MTENIQRIKTFHDHFNTSGLQKVELDDGTSKTAVISVAAVFPELRKRLLEEFRRIRKLLPVENQSSPRLLSIGLGNGIIEEELQKNGFQVEGIELSEVQAEEARKRGILVKVGDVHKILPRLTDESFNIVFIGEAIGYLEVDKIFLETERVLADGGVIVVTSYPVSSEEEFKVSPTHYVNVPVSRIKEELAEAGLQFIEEVQILRAEFSGFRIHKHIKREVISSVIVGRKAP